MTTADEGRSEPAHKSDLLLRETIHRSSNDLQLVVSLLAMQSRQSANAEVKHALAGAMERVMILARARADTNRLRSTTLKAALHQVCEALRAHAEPRSITINLNADEETTMGLSATEITTLALVVNELATNAIKHAFEEGKAGLISVSAIKKNAENTVHVLVDDDWLPLPELEGTKNGLGLELIKRLVASIDGILILPPKGAKMFEVRLATRS